MGATITREWVWDKLRRAQGVARIERRLEREGAHLRQELRVLLRDELEAQVRLPLLARVDELERRLAQVHDFLVGDLRSILRSIASEDAENRRRLWRLREQPEYELPFSDPEPLVSVIIPTVDRAELLRTRSLPSILAQSYQRLEVLVIGDHAGPEIERAVAAVGDRRVSFHNLSQRLPPNPDPLKRWQAGSVMARNEGFRLARGSWLMSFDDDDELYPESVARLLGAARDRRAEVAYGRFRQFGSGKSAEHGGFPPAHGEFAWQCAIRHGGLRFFERELFAADFGMPNDFFTADAMLRAGVRFAMIPEMVFDYFPASARD